MITFEALNAKFGDALLLHFEDDGEKRLWIVDGGPGGTWNKFLRPRLEELRGEDETLPVDLVMLSHVDGDHINGILKMTKGLAEDTPDGMKSLDIRRFWHNSFADLVGSEAGLQAGLAALAGLQAGASAAMAGGSSLNTAGVILDKERELAVLATIGDGRELRDYLVQLELDGNDPFNAILSSDVGETPLDGATIKIVGPIASRLEAFRIAWEQAAGSPAAMASLFNEDLDESPTNLSSIVALVEIDGCKILLTGDARGDDIVAGFKEAGLGSLLPLKLDILKVPHHGSDRNMTEEFVESFPADHYLISADGTHGNPDEKTLRGIVEMRGDDAYSIHLTNRVTGLPELLEELSQGRNFEFFFRDNAKGSIIIELP
jgi:hypothetical protein